MAAGAETRAAGSLKMTYHRLVVLVASLAVAGTAVAAAQQTMPAHDASHEPSLGSVDFQNSCAPAVQAEFQRGVAMLHSYWFGYAGKTFRAILEKDPGCAMAYWGIALDLLGNSLSSPPSRQNADAAWKVLEEARAVPVKTERERAWLNAVRAYFKDHATVPLATRLTAYTDEMRKIAAIYRNDVEAQVFYALTLQASASKSDLTYANQLESAAILEKVFAANPKHPGATHFIIHAYDYAPLATRGIPAARRYAGIAPAVPHARHMPAHIYSMTGMWEDSIASNLSAIEIQPDYYHAADFTVYAYLQLAQDAKARAMVAKATTTPVRGDRPVSMSNFTALAAMPARLALEQADWKAAAALPVTPTAYPQADAITRFTRGLGLARTNDTAGALQEGEALDALRRALAAKGEQYWADRTGEQILAVMAWVALAEGQKEAAVKAMRQAADGEDASVKDIAMENRLYPLRELLGDLLRAAGQPQAALREYRTALAATPNRYRGLFGAAVAAQAAGDKAAAAEYFTQLVALAGNADTERPELARARAFLSER
jgi:tetratricopeptide (TPR) repeat protein